MLKLQQIKNNPSKKGRLGLLEVSERQTSVLVGARQGWKGRPMLRRARTGLPAYPNDLADSRKGASVLVVQLSLASLCCLRGQLGQDDLAGSYMSWLTAAKVTAKVAAKTMKSAFQTCGRESSEA